MGLLDLFKGKPDPPDKEAIIASAFEKLDGLVRHASVATLGVEQPSGDPRTSKFSGDFVMLPDEEWPTWEGKPLQAFLQINTTQLTEIPEALGNYKLITVFVNEKELPFEMPHGKGWLVRCYASLDGLEARSNPITGSRIRPCEITWTTFQDSPGWDDFPTGIDMKAFNGLRESDKLLEDRYKNFKKTKVGGWPSLIQGSLDMGASNFQFQVGSEQKANWNCIDAGTMYFGLVNGEWKFECQVF